MDYGADGLEDTLRAGERKGVPIVGGGRSEAARLGVPLLAQVPIDIPTREAGDRGLPVTAVSPDCAVAKVFVEISKSLRQALEKSAVIG